MLPDLPQMSGLAKVARQEKNHGNSHQLFNNYFHKLLFAPQFLSSATSVNRAAT